MNVELREKQRVVYAIKHNPTGKIYVGSSNGLRVKWRIKDHMDLIRRGKHPIKEMIDDYKKYGNDYTFYLLDFIPTERYKEREYYWMHVFKTTDSRYGYNNYDHQAKAPDLSRFCLINMEGLV